MPNETQRPPKSLEERIEERIKELAQDLLEALESLVTPQPELVPVPARSPRRPYRR